MKYYFILTVKLMVFCILIVDTLAQSLAYNRPAVKVENQTGNPPENMGSQKQKDYMHSCPNKPTTLGDEARNKLQKIYQAIGRAQESPGAIKVLDLLTESWSKYDTETRWANNVAGDRCPLEFSLTFKGNKELPIVRFLIEPQESPFTLQSSWKVGLELKEKLGSLPGVDISNFDKIYSIFSPIVNPQVPTTYESFSIWYAADLEHNHPKFKVYFNPRILGGEKAPELIRQALITLDAEASWNFLSPRLNIAHSESKLAFFSLDLTAGVKARTKVYVANKLINDIERQLQGCHYYVNGAASSWIKTLIKKEDFFNVKPIIITFNFTVGDDVPVPTIHIPVDAYVNNDAVIIQRMNKLLSPNQIKILTEAISHISEKPLESTNFLTYVSLRPSENGQLDITCYLSL